MQPFFLRAPVGQRLCIHHPPAGAARGAVLYLHPFAEEMNKSRRMAALASRALAAAGFGVLQIDLYGCGDSSGEFADAAWQDWIDDAVLGVDWLRERHASLPLWLWGLRAGCLVASATAARIGGRRLLLWQPPTSGKTLLQQFLRLKMAAQLQDGAAAGATAAARRMLDAGETVDVAGYGLGPALARGLEAATLELPSPASQAIVVEAGTRLPVAPLPATAAVAERWRGAGHQVALAAVAGPAFWQTQEIETAPEMIAITLQQLRSAAVPAEREAAA